MLIGELSKLSGLSKDGLRHYEALGLIHSTPREAGSRVYREYDDSTLERLSIIALARRLHIPLKDLASVLDKILADEISREGRAALMAEQIAAVDRKIADLQDARAELVGLLSQPDKEYVDARLKALGLWLKE